MPPFGFRLIFRLIVATIEMIEEIMMKKNLLITFALFALIFSIFLGSAPAQDFPSQASQAQQSQVARQSEPNQPFYGYVPPPPIRHTWPGGYKVIFHELLNTLSEHMLGQY